MTEPDLGPRAIARQAIRNRIQEVAERLFDEHGYRETTVGTIAEEVGISERTFFRYFATKDDLLFSSVEADTQWALESVDGRPSDEDPWDTLQAVVESAVDRITEHAQHRSALFQRIAAESPQVSATYLNHLHAFHRSIGEALWARGRTDADDETRGSDDRIVLHAVVSAVFAAISEVVALSSDQSPAEQKRLIRTTLTAMRPSFGGANIRRSDALAPR